VNISYMRTFPLPILFAAAVAFTGCGTNINSTPPPAKAIQVTIQDKPTSLNFGSSAIPLGVTVSNDSSNEGVTWTIGIQGGGNCTVDICGTLVATPAPSFAAAYTAPIGAPPQGSVTVQITATSVADTSKSDSFTLNYAPVLTPSLLKGNYSFLLRGFSSAGVPIALAGSIIADGQGNITGGDLDLNQGGIDTKASAPLAGTYLLDTSFHSTAHGTVNLTNFTVPGGSAMSLTFFLSSSGQTGGIIEHDANNFICAGRIFLQDTAALNAGIPSGPFVFGLDSDAPIGVRTVENGQFVLSAGSVSSGLADLSKAGNASPIYAATAISSGTATAPDSAGRGTLSLTIAGNSTGYAFYIANSHQVLLIETDSGSAFGTVQAGVAQQQLSLTAGAVNAVSVLQLTGLGTPSGAQAVGTSVIIGQMTISGGSSFSAVLDSNNLGTVLATQALSGQISSFNPATGRGVISVAGGFDSAFLDSAVFYLSSPGNGFLIDADKTAGGVANRAFSGTLTAQQSPPITNAAFSNDVVIWSGGSSANYIPSIDAAAIVDNTVQSLTGLGDLSALPAQSGNETSRSFSTGYQITDTQIGYGYALLPARFFGNFTLNEPAPCSFYVIGPDQAVFIGTLSGTPSGVTFFQP
jgi:hypothetical protein